MKRLENNLVEGVTYIYDETTKKIWKVKTSQINFLI